MPYSTDHTKSEHAERGMAVDHARRYFPRGLVQPPESFRFSVDALLLACYAASALESKGHERASTGAGKVPCPSITFTDMGAGCGVVGLALCLLQPGVQGIGIDMDPGLVAAARHNAELLGFEARFEVRRADVSTMRQTRVVLPESQYMVLANPPYRRTDQGRLSATRARSRALFEVAGTLDAFVAASAYVLRNKGRFFCVYPAERVTDLLHVLRMAGLEPKHMLPIHSRVEASAKLVLLEARKNAKPGITMHAPLVLYQGHGIQTRLTGQALRFCPFLDCNAHARVS